MSFLFFVQVLYRGESRVHISDAERVCGYHHSELQLEQGEGLRVHSVDRGAEAVGVDDEDGPVEQGNEASAASKEQVPRRLARPRHEPRV